MLAHRAFWLKVVLAVFAVYCIVHLSNGTASSVVRRLQQSGRNLAAIDPQPGVGGAGGGGAEQTAQEAEPLGAQQQQLLEERARAAEAAAAEAEAEAEAEVEAAAAAGGSVGGGAVDERMLLEQSVVSSEVDAGVLERVRTLTGCTDKPPVARTQQRGDYWVLYNYVPGERRFRCHESVTYTTHGDYSFLDNLGPLLERWQGPVSIALHAPGTDFRHTVDAIAYLRECTDPLVKQLVTFHIYFSTKHVPKEVPKHSNVFLEPYNCSALPPYHNVSAASMYKTQKKLLYPVNVGRNVARETAQTHFILPSDIELYPSPNIIPQFLQMVAENTGPLLSKNPKVYPLHIFEVAANQPVPENKTMLKEMLANGTAVPFHKKLCPGCHSVPKAKEWQAAPETKGLHVFHVGKRNGRFVHWEPIFIGTHADPLYDERLSWEGKSDKMTQGYALCVLDYDFLIIDNAFLVHKPGIKVYKHDARRNMLAAKTNQLIKKIIFPELKVLYGVKKGCAV